MMHGDHDHTHPHTRDDHDMTPSGLDVLIPPNPDAPDDAPAKARAKQQQRPTTRAGRRAAAEARKAAGGTDNRPKKTTTSAPRKATLETRLNDSITTLGMIVAGVGGMTSPAVQADGVLVIQHAPNLASALDTVAKNDPRVARALERMLTVGTYGVLLAAVTPLALGIAANHGIVPPALAAQLGATVPEQPADEPAPPGSVPLV